MDDITEISKLSLILPSREETRGITVTPALKDTGEVGGGGANNFYSRNNWTLARFSVRIPVIRVALGVPVPGKSNE